MVKPIPTGFHAITPSLVVKGAAEAIEYYKRAFGAEENSRMQMPTGDGGSKIGHAELQIGDSKLCVCDEFPEHGVTAPQQGHSPVCIIFYVTDIDAVYARAVEEGATPLMPPADMFWGDRYGKLVDPFGHQWALATHIEDLTPEQMRERMSNAVCESTEAAVEA